MSYGCIPISLFSKMLKVLGFKCSRYQLQTIIKEEETKLSAYEEDGEVSAIAPGSRAPDERAFGFDNLLQVVDHLQGDDYDLYDEMRQVWYTCLYWLKVYSTCLIFVFKLKIDIS